MPFKGERHPHRGCTYEERYGLDRAVEIKATLRAKLALRGDSYRQAMSRAKCGEVRSLETRLKMSLAKKGLKHSLEHRKHNGDVRRGKKIGQYSADRIWRQRLGLLLRRMIYGYKCSNKDWRKGGMYKRWRLDVLNRCGTMCSVCSSQSDKLEVHHVLSRRWFSSFMWNVENGLPLCCRCHVIVNAMQRAIETVICEPVMAVPRLR